MKREQPLPIMHDLTRLTKDLLTTARVSNHRRGLVLAGEHAWCKNTAQTVLSSTGFLNVLWISTHAPPNTWSILSPQVHSLLGCELDAVVFDTYCGFDLDAFGAISGTVRGGGLLVLLTPPLKEWADYSDPQNRRITVALYAPDDVTGRFFRHMVRTVRKAEGIEIVEEEHKVDLKIPDEGNSRGQSSSIPRCSINGRIHRKSESNDLYQRSDLTGHSSLSASMYGDKCRTADQRRAVAAIVKVVTGHRRRPVVLTSDRGRGKSAALGIAAAYLLEQGVRHIVVTGPRLNAVQPVFEHAHRLLPTAHASKAALHLGEAYLEFMPPDQLVHAPSPAELLLIDEAAAIPTPLLEQLLEHYSRIAFATTIHGYEGTGRGFAVRFNKILNQRTRGWKALRLETPIRWGPYDPIEKFVFQALLLDAAAAPDDKVAAVVPDSCVIEQVNRDRLVDDEKTLSEFFGLLVLAHYRTRPHDLRHMLDGPNLSIYVMRYDGHVVATALVAYEGGFDSKTARAIWEGRTRPHGHLIPESLAAHVGLEHAPTLRCARIMRIAVHPAAQGRGLGTRLVEVIVEKVRKEQLDYVGSSFGATDELLAFWAKVHYVPVRLSIKRGATSGAHSVIVLQPVSNRGRVLVEVARKQFINLFPHQLSDPLRELEPQLAIFLIRHTQTENFEPPGLTTQDWSDVVAFAFAKRVYEVCIAPLWKLTCTALADPHSDFFLDTTDRSALVLKVLQKRKWQEAAKALDVAGRADVIETLRHATRSMVLHYGDTTARAESARIRQHSTHE